MPAHQDIFSAPNYTKGYKDAVLSSYPLEATRQGKDQPSYKPLRRDRKKIPIFLSELNLELQKFYLENFLYCKFKALFLKLSYFCL